MSYRKSFVPPAYVTASLLVSIGGLINGYDTGTIGAVTQMSTFIKIAGELSPTMRGVTVSVIMLASAVSSLFAGALAHRFSHLNIMGLGACIVLVGIIIEGVSYKLAMFIIGRAIAGIGQGLWLGNANIYICEISPSAKRGMLIAIPQLMVTVGIFLGYFTCYGTVQMQSSLSWRIPYIIQVIMATTLAASCVFLPKSPRWLVLNGQKSKASAIIRRLGISDQEAESSILNVTDLENCNVSRSCGATITLPFERRHRPKTLLGFFILAMVGLCGIDGILYYAPVLFNQAGLEEQTATFLASGVSAILMLTISIPAMLFADRWGRRTSMLVGGGALSTCMLLIGILYASDSAGPHSIGRWFVIVFIYLFAMSYCATWAVAGKIYASEIQAGETRAAVNGAGQGLNFLANFIVSLITPVFIAKSPYGAYFLFGGFSIVATIVLYFYMPETMGLSLELVQMGFDRPFSFRSGFSKRDVKTLQHDTVEVNIEDVKGDKMYR